MKEENFLLLKGDHAGGTKTSIVHTWGGEGGWREGGDDAREARAVWGGRGGGCRSAVGKEPVS